jgi:rubrerythrin
MKYILKPFGNGANCLNTLEFEHENQSLKLGRNSETGLDRPCEHIQHVSRSHVMMTYRHGKLFMDVISRQDDIVYVNGAVCERGEVELHTGDEISLLGSIQFFNYRVQTVETGSTQELDLRPSKKQKTATDSSKPMTTATPAASTTSPEEEQKKPETTTSSSSSSSQNHHHKLLEGLLRQYECEICFEVMACAYSLYPCGDCFCYVCIEDWSKNAKATPNCPHCQGTFDLNSAIPNKKNDNAVREILKLDPEQLKQWEARVEEGLQRRKLFNETPRTTNVPPPQVNPAQPLPRGNTILSHFRFANPNPTNNNPAVNNNNNNNNNFHINPAGNLFQLLPQTAFVPPQQAQVIPLVNSPATTGRYQRPSRRTPPRRNNYNSGGNGNAAVDLIVDLTSSNNNNNTNNSSNNHPNPNNNRNNSNGIVRL